VRALVLALFAIGCGGSQPVELTSIEVAPDGYSVEQGVQLQATATGHYSDGTTRDLTATATWSSSDLTVATIDTNERVFTVGLGAATLAAASDGKTGTANLTVVARTVLLANVGVWAQFDERGAPSGYYDGDLLARWNQDDPVVGHTVADEVRLQLDAMQALGATSITFELRATDATYVNDGFMPPTCNIPPVLGLLYPQPAASDLANLGALFDEVQARGMNAILLLDNTHMEEQPPTNNTTWLTAILQAVGNHPAVEVIGFGGDVHVHNFPSGMVCGIPAEPALWEGPGAADPAYVQWAIGLGLSLGIPARRLSAEAVVGSETTSEPWPAGSDFTGGHFWWPIDTETAIFDALSVPASERTYLLSFYEHTKCFQFNLAGETCTEESAESWAEDTMARIAGAITPGARVIAAEFGNTTPLQPGWSTEHALESFGLLARAHGFGGGTFWRWSNVQNTEDADPTVAAPLRPRGQAFTYNPVARVFVDLAGWHLRGIANGSFESGTMSWAQTGTGTMTVHDLTTDPGGPEVPWRGTHALRLTTSDTITVEGDPVPVQPTVVYTTSASLRFTFSDDAPTATIAAVYLRSDGSPSLVRVSDTTTFHRADAPSGFAMLPVQYAPPADAASVAIQIIVASNGSSGTAVVDVDDVH
jgi:hypothetical protein